MSALRTPLAALALFALTLGAPAFAATPPAKIALPLPDDGLQTPEPLPLAPPCSSCVSGFTSSPGGGAASHWGFGSDCTAALSDLRAQLSAYANDVCAIEGDYGRCAFSVIQTSSCFYSSGHGAYQIDGYTNFSCWISWC